MPNEEFNSFEDAWDFIHGELTERIGLMEEDYQEYEVRKSTNKRETRYLDPRDIRNGNK